MRLGPPWPRWRRALGSMPTARAFRDSRLASIGGGADEVMLQIISKHMGTLPRLENR